MVVAGPHRRRFGSVLALGPSIVMGPAPRFLEREAARSRNLLGMKPFAGRSLRPGRRLLLSAAAGLLCAGLAGATLVQSGLVSVSARSDATTPSPTGSPALATAPLSPSPALSAGASFAAAPPPSAAPSPASATYAMPVVPVESFWSPPGSVSLVDLSRLWSGSGATPTPSGGPLAFTALAVPSADVAALTRFFGEPPGSAVRAVSVDGVRSAVRSSPSTLGLLEADDVTPDVRALAVDGVELFGSSHLADPLAWRLKIAAAAPSRVLTDAVWTLAAGGDVNLDRRVYVAAVEKKMGPDYPWLGGTARISGYECCDLTGAGIVRAKSRSPGDALRSRFANADLAFVNLEGSAPNDHIYRPNSLVFTFDPDLLPGLADAGIDLVSLANNHVRNGGDPGVLDTIANLDRAGLAHVGAGANSTEAAKPAWLSAGGRRIAVLAYSAVGSGAWATSAHPGAAALKTDRVLADIAAARASGADLVVVMPHWGREYSYDVSPVQKSQAAAFVAAGADLVLGSHSHWVGGIQTLAGVNGPAFVDYSMGDLLFDLNHDSASLEAEVVTLTFVGRTLVQVQLDPTIMVGGAQVGLLDPTTEGKPIIDAIRAASQQFGG